MPGYDPNFLAQEVPLPSFSPSIDGDVLRRVELRDERFADYVNYTVAMHRPFRTPLFAALNVDQDLKRKTKRSNNWRIDSRIGAENQLDNAYYRHNPWDRGHLARRDTAGWGSTQKIAQRSSDETFYYSNASLQHENFNQDEWLALEDWVAGLDLDEDDRFSVFSGPVFGDFMRAIRPVGREPGFVPPAFFKIVFFMNKSGELDVRAFLVPQDEEALEDKRGRRMFNHQFYQVSVAEIEELTGLDFPEILPERNPIYYNPSDDARDRNVHELPERREVDGPDDIIRNNDEPRPIRFMDEEVDVFIAAALVNPEGDERKGEWVSIINLETTEVSLDGWTLVDDKRRKKRLSGSLGPGEALRVQPLSPVQLANNRKAFIQLINDKDEQIDRVPYTRQQAQVQGRPIIFAYRDIEYDQHQREDDE